MSESSVEHRQSSAKLNVFVHLAENKDAERWRAGWVAGSLVGINDDTPYGYGRATSLGCNVTFSRAYRETILGKFARYGLRLVLGFDFLHALRQRHELRRADVIWTHTESQYLAVAAVMSITGIRTKLIGQTVWLFDHWRKLSWAKRWMYSALIRRVDVLTFLSPANMRIAKRLFPDADVRFVPFGIPAENKIAPRRRVGDPFQILAVGSDRHRDWKTLVDVVKQRPDFFLTILSGTVPKRLVAGIANVEVRLAKSTRELLSAFDRANVVCVPLQENLHASGITVIEEAVLAGLPVLASNTGGLRHYFSGDEIRYVPPGDQAALLQALNDIREKPEDALQRAVRAQTRMGREGLGADDYVRRHVRISQDILCHDSETLDQQAAMPSMGKMA